MQMRMKKTAAVLAAAVIGLAAAPAFALDEFSVKLNAAGVTKQPAVSEDYYLHQNFDWLKHNKIPATQSDYGSFTIVALSIEDRLSEITKNCLKAGGKYGEMSDEARIANLRRCIADVKGRNKTGLGELAAPHGAWVRLHYVYPYPHVDDILPLMAEGKVLPYLDVPFQHSHPDVLRRMKRPASGERNLERIARWREMCPDLVIRSTFIAGFPGETEEEFEHLLDFMREARIDRAGCFAYSPVEGAAANDLPGMLPAEVREERRARFMAVAEEVSTAKLRERIGATMRVLVDAAPAMGRRGGVGRSYADAPEIDGVVQLLPPEKISKQLKVGEFTRARIVGAQGHDLVALPI